MSHLVEQHSRQSYCRTRPAYRNSRLPTAVKVYTVADESKYLLIFGVPKINLIQEVRKEFTKYGPLRRIEIVTDELATKSSTTIEQFTDCIRIVYDKLEHARRAKRLADAKNFYGGILHVSYAPEYETVDELLAKLQQRHAEVRYRMRKNAHDFGAASGRKRKAPAD